MTIDLETLTIQKAHKHLVNKDFSTVELAQAYLDAIAEKDKEIHAYLQVFDDVLEQAKKADERIAQGDATLLTGIPIAVKDNILIEGRTVSSASKILENYTASYDATVISKLKKEGVVFLGRTNMDDSAMGASTERSAFGPTRNPHDTTRVPGGSSGGSTAAVASNMALAALGSDTGGSIRQPSALCGVVGLKPTYGAVSRHGLMALASSFDCIGCMAKNVEDTEIVFNAIQGHDPMDSTSLQGENPKSQIPNTHVRPGGSRTKYSIGVPADLLSMEGLSKQSRDNFEHAIAKLQKLGHTVKDITLPHSKYAIPVYYIILPAEASANLARYDGVKYGLHEDGADLIDDYFKTRGKGFGPEPKKRILIGTFVLSSGHYDAYYHKANAVRELIGKDFEKAFGEVDLIALPTTAGPAFPIGEKANDPIAMYLEDMFTSPANLTGLPAISVPSGFVEAGEKQLPLGIQFYAPHVQEERLFAVGKSFLDEK